jgi:PiT family inorganic phosphate transporter
MLNCSFDKLRMTEWDCGGLSGRVRRPEVNGYRLRLHQANETSPNRNVAVIAMPSLTPRKAARQPTRLKDTIMHLWGETLTFSAGFFLLFALALALAFEFVNGFHDTANAVATVIYTNTLKPIVAVVWSGMWNLFGALGIVGAFLGLFGVAAASSAVAYGIVALLPVELVLNSGSGAGFAMIFALLVSAILWNVGTWYMGLPASSSHTLIGSIMGVGVADSIIAGHGWAGGINWDQAYKIGAALLFSPIIGFVGAGLLLLLMKLLIPRKDLFQAPPDKETPPPLWIRCLLVVTCTLVSVFHGSNDAQKGMGLIMLILVGLVPGAFALDMATTPATLQKTTTELRQVIGVVTPLAQGTTLPNDQAQGELTAYIKPSASAATAKTFAAVAAESQAIIDQLGTRTNFNSLPHDTRIAVRNDIYLVDSALDKFGKKKLITDPAGATVVKSTKGDLDKMVKYIPIWVKFAVACALGFGTMIGWKRIVVTVGEKIGKSHLTYAQGASAELMAAATIGLADGLGLPVSTTHVLSSGIAGTMAANRSGLQTQTLINILLAWVLTLPVCVFLGATLFSAGLYVTFHVFGIR